MTTSIAPTPTVVLRLAKRVNQHFPSAIRTYGTITVKNAAQLIQAVDLEANPRNSKVGPVTREIVESLRDDPELMPLKAKGVVLGSSSYRELDRDRLQLSFQTKDSEGILDGGHTLLAVGIYFLQEAIDPKRLKQQKKIEYWKDLKEVFDILEPELSAVFHPSNEDGLEHLSQKIIPIEVILPADEDDKSLVDYRNALFPIQSARNNNSPVKDSSKIDHRGLFDQLKTELPVKVSEETDWKQNSGYRIQPQQPVAHAWIAILASGYVPLDEMGKPVKLPGATQLYASKGACVSLWDDYFSSNDVTSDVDGTKRELRNSKVLSALKVAAAMPDIFEFIEVNFADYYNSAGGRYGRISAVKEASERPAARKSKYYETPMDQAVPEGFIAPLLYATQELMDLDETGHLKWGSDPIKFLEKHMPDLMKEYDGLMDECDFDPQKVGKSRMALKVMSAAVRSLRSA